MNETVVTGEVPSSLPVVPTAEMTTPVEATGKGLGSLVWRGILLTIITLGIYRFWYKTNLRRWYWRHTLVGTPESGGQHGFEYRGNAKEKLLGFLFALAVVLPISFLGTVVSLFASENLGNLVSSLSVLVIGFLVQYGAYRSRRYRLTRTVWRGLRFDLKGSAWTYALKSAGWGLLTLITLGLAFPVMRRSLAEYRTNNTWFGTAKGQFSARTGPLMKRWLVLWLGTILVLVLAMYLGIAYGTLNPQTGNLTPGGPAILMMFLGLLWPFLLWPWYRANEFRLFTNNTKIGAVSFTSTLPTVRNYGLYLTFGSIMLFILLVFVSIFGGALFSHWPKLVTGEVPTSFVAILMLLYLSLFLLFSLFKETILNQGFWRIAADTLSIHNLASLDDVLGAAVADEAATGEGLADALDFGGI